MNERGMVERQNTPGRPPTDGETRPLAQGQMEDWQAALDAERIRIAIRLLPIMVGVGVIESLTFPILYFMLGRPWQAAWLMTQVILSTLLFLLAYLTARRGRLIPSVYLTTLGILLTAVVVPALAEGTVVTGIAAGMVAIILARLLAGRTQNRVIVATSTLAATAGILLSSFRVVEPLPLPLWSQVSINIIALDLASLIIALFLDSRDARYEAALAQAAAYSAQVEAQRAVLEQRTHELLRRTRYQEATAEVAKDVASLLDLQTLLSRVVTLISERFGFYHAGIFLSDPSHEWAVLRAASSEGGQRMLQQGHRLQVGTGIVGYVVAKGEPRIAMDVGADAVFFDNPELPETRSELALPLRARGEIIGALDVQSREPAAFSQEDVAVLQTLADQVAMAISNARLFRQFQESLEAERRAYGELSFKAWSEMLQSQAGLGYRYARRAVTPHRATEEVQQPGPDLPEIRLPIQHLGQKLGTLVAHKPADSGDWTAGEVELLETLADQLSAALESARLYEETQRRAAQDRLIGRVAARIRETLDVQRVLETAADELYQALGLEKVVVGLTIKDGNGNSA